MEKRRKKVKRVILVAMLLGLMLSGCARLNKITNLYPQDDNCTKAQVYIIRSNAFAGGGSPVGFYVNDQLLARLYKGTHVKVCIPENKYKLSAKFEGSNLFSSEKSVTVWEGDELTKLENGKKHYFLFDMGFWDRVLFFDQVSPLDAREYLQYSERIKESEGDVRK